MMRTRTWRHPASLFWMILPALAVNELLLGQRMPKKLLVESDRKKPLAQRSYVPCPHCQTLHPSLKWSMRNHTALGNWFGYYCDHCGGVIPCLWNMVSLMILGVTAPLWIWFRKPMKKRWLRSQQKKCSRPLNLEEPGFNWPVHGILWGCFMFLFMGLFYPWATGTAMSRGKTAFTLLWWLTCSLGYGYFMKILQDREDRKKQKTARV